MCILFGRGARRLVSSGLGAGRSEPEGRPPRSHASADTRLVHRRKGSTRATNARCASASDCCRSVKGSRACDHHSKTAPWSVDAGAEERGLLIVADECDRCARRPRWLARTPTRRWPISTQYQESSRRRLDRATALLRTTATRPGSGGPEDIPPPCQLLTAFHFEEALDSECLEDSSTPRRQLRTCLCRIDDFGFDDVDAWPPIVTAADRRPAHCASQSTSVP